MGSPESELGRWDDELQHQVTLTRDFWLMTTEVTQEQFMSIAGENPSHFKRCGLTYPLHTVNWFVMAAYANALSQAEGLDECYDCTGSIVDAVCTPSSRHVNPYDCPGYRMPTEAEWEYAARGVTTTATYNGNLDFETGVSAVLEPIAWYRENSSKEPHPVMQKSPNPFGLYDMRGNIDEWCHDWGELYPGQDEIDPTGPPSGSHRILRGGFYDSPLAGHHRAAFRGYCTPEFTDKENGGRLARTAW
jgi:formylglycine-generating enzyme required for sulfatase activity